MLRIGRFEQPLKGQPGSNPLLFRHRLLVNVERNPGICMAEQLLSCLDVYPLLPQHRCQPVPETVPPDPLLDSKTLQRWPDMTLEDHVRLDRLCPIFCDGGEKIVVVGAVQRGLSSCALWCVLVSRKDVQPLLVDGNHAFHFMFHLGTRGVGDNAKELLASTAELKSCLSLVARLHARFLHTAGTSVVTLSIEEQNGTEMSV